MCLYICVCVNGHLCKGFVFHEAPFRRVNLVKSLVSIRLPFLLILFACECVFGWRRSVCAASFAVGSATAAATALDRENV